MMMDDVDGPWCHPRMDRSNVIIHLPSSPTTVSPPIRRVALIPGLGESDGVSRGGIAIPIHSPSYRQTDKDHGGVGCRCAVMPCAAMASVALALALAPGKSVTETSIQHISTHIKPSCFHRSALFPFSPPYLHCPSPRS